MLILVDGVKDIYVGYKDVAFWNKVNSEILICALSRWSIIYERRLYFTYLHRLCMISDLGIQKKQLKRISKNSMVWRYNGSRVDLG